MTKSLLINQLFDKEQRITRKGKAEKKKGEKKKKKGPHVTFCSIILRQLHEILNSAITGKKKIALNKHAIMDYVIAINTRSAIN